MHLHVLSPLGYLMVLRVAVRAVADVFRVRVAHGRSKTICVRTDKAEEILKRAQALKESRGKHTRSWVERKRIVTKRPSIQGQWNPFFTFQAEPQSLTEFKPVGDKYRRPKYGVARRKVTSFEPRSIPADEFKRLSTIKKAMINKVRHGKAYSELSL